MYNVIIYPIKQIFTRNEFPVTKSSDIFCEVQTARRGRGRLAQECFSTLIGPQLLMVVLDPLHITWKKCLKKFILWSSYSNCCFSFAAQTRLQRTNLTLLKNVKKSCEYKSSFTFFWWWKALSCWVENLESNYIKICVLC